MVKKILCRNIPNDVSAIAMEEKSGAQLQVQWEQVGIYSQWVGWGASVCGKSPVRHTKDRGLLLNQFNSIPDAGSPEWSDIKCDGGPMGRIWSPIKGDRILRVGGRFSLNWLSRIHANSLSIVHLSFFQQFIFRNAYFCIIIRTVFIYMTNSDSFYKIRKNILNFLHIFISPKFSK